MQGMQSVQAASLQQVCSNLNTVVRVAVLCFWHISSTAMLNIQPISHYSSDTCELWVGVLKAARTAF
jgi:hypothetical protein